MFLTLSFTPFELQKDVGTLDSESTIIPHHSFNTEYNIDSEQQLDLNAKYIDTLTQDTNYRNLTSNTNNNISDRNNSDNRFADNNYTFRLTIYNINGIKNNTNKLYNLLDMLDNKGIDVIGITETN